MGVEQAAPRARAVGFDVARTTAFFAVTVLGSLVGRLTFIESAQVVLISPLAGIGFVWLATGSPRREWWWDLPALTLAQMVTVVLTGRNDSADRVQRPADLDPAGRHRAAHAPLGTGPVGKRRAAAARHGARPGSLHRRVPRRERGGRRLPVVGPRARAPARPRRVRHGGHPQLLLDLRHRTGGPAGRSCPERRPGADRRGWTWPGAFAPRPHRWSWRGWPSSVVTAGLYLAAFELPVTFAISLVTVWAALRFSAGVGGGARLRLRHHRAADDPVGESGCSRR